MKKYAKKTLLAAAALVTLTSLQSCLNNDDNYDYSLVMPNAIVTVKPVTDGEKEYFYLQLNEQEKLWPDGNSSHPYGEKEVRAFVNYTETDMPDDVDGEVYSQAVKINWMDCILTKTPVVCQAAEDGNISTSDKYGTDPVSLFNDWMTNVEDGYLTLHFFTLFGNTGISHELNLLLGLNPDDPYEVYFKHNAHGDNPSKQGEGFVAFCLKDLPDTGGETVDLTLKFDTFSGQTETVKFKYRTRDDWSTAAD